MVGRQDKVRFWRQSLEKPYEAIKPEWGDLLLSAW